LIPKSGALSMNGVQGSSGKSLYGSKGLSTLREQWRADESSLRGGGREALRYSLGGTVRELLRRCEGRLMLAAAGAIHLGQIAPDAAKLLAAV
jgi:hypothetical protein